MTTLRAFHGDPAIKAQYLARVRAHRIADDLTQGTGWENGKGCAVGCTLEAYDHSRYPVELGLPEWLAHLEDAIFEGLPHAQAMDWPEQFLEAIPVGADIGPVMHRAAIRRMDRLLAAISETAVIAAINGVRACHVATLRGEGCDWEAAWSAAAWSAEAVAEAADEAAEAAEAAAWSAAWSTTAADEAAEAAARSAAWAAARSAPWSAEAADLLRYLREAA